MTEQNSEEILEKKIIVAIIPARGGSKGLPGKNILNFSGKPLIAWTIEAALKCKRIDRVVVSTDDEEIARISGEYGAEVPFMRPSVISQDDSSSVDVVLHALDHVQASTFVLLQPTSPLRTAEHIDNAIQRMEELIAPACVSVCMATENPYWMFIESTNGGLKPIVETASRPFRRQDSPRILIPNGAIYISKVLDFRKHRAFIYNDSIGFEMAPEESIDIDTIKDFELAEKFM